MMNDYRYGKMPSYKKSLLLEASGVPAPRNVKESGWRLQERVRSTKADYRRK